MSTSPSLGGKKIAKASLAAAVDVGGAGGTAGSAAGGAAVFVAAQEVPTTKEKKRKATVAKSAATDAAADDDIDVGAEAAVEDTGRSAPKKARAVKVASPYAGVDPSTMEMGAFLPASSMAAFVASLPPRQLGVKVLSYNVNGLRAAIKGDRKDEFLAWIAAEDPDILCLQEIKADADVVAKEKFASLFPTLPHATFAPGDPAIDGFKKGYAGVAIFSKTAPLETAIGLDDATHDAAGRFIAARFAWGTVVSVYVPNSGQSLDRLEYRTASWDIALRKRLGAITAAAGGRVLVVGDLNVAFNDADVEGHASYRNKIAGFCDGERIGFANLLAAGFRDPWRIAHPNVKEYSESLVSDGGCVDLLDYHCALSFFLPKPTPHTAYFSTRNKAARDSGKGWRVDYALASHALTDVTVEHRATMPGVDHLPLCAYVK